MQLTFIYGWKGGVKMNIKNIIAALNGIAALFLFSVTVLAADSTVVVTGDTSAGENQPGWLFNRDEDTDTPFEFNSDEASIGAGSLYVLPIGANPSDKFIAENFLATPVSLVNALSYDFLIAESGDADDAEQFYLNVYANIDDSDNYYDCRFDYVPSEGSTSEFTTFVVNVTDAPTAVTKHGSSTIVACPATLAEMPVGSYVRAFAINVGDTSDNDTGLAGYLDNVVVDLDDEITTYDFEPVLSPVSKDECKKGGWMSFNSPSFKNQGQCVSYVNHLD